MSSKQLDPTVVASVARKLDEFNEVLTDDERAVLLGVFGIAQSTIDAHHQERQTESGRLEGDSVLIRPDAGRLPKLSSAFAGTFSRLGTLDPAGPVSDSIGVGVLCVSWSKDYNKMPDQLGPRTSIPGLKNR